MIITGKKFSKPEMSRVINGDITLDSPDEKPEKVRLDHMMVKIYKSYNRSTIQKFIESGFVTVDGEVAKKPNQKFEEGVKIDLQVPEDLKNADVKPEIIYEDENVIVVNKPEGLLSEAKGEYCPEKTLADFGFVAHRLDRDTSGVMILAKSEDVQKFLKKQFQDRKVHKTYYAIVQGRPKLDEARIDLPLKRDLKHPTTFRVDAGGKASETFYKVLKSNDRYSLVELKPTTGRTHQLRVHMKYLGHPILGDPVYGEEKADRLYLHAGSLEVTLPGGIRKVFEAPLPKEFKNVFNDIKEIKEIASRSGCAVFVVPDCQKVEIKNAIVLEPTSKTVISIDDVKELILKLSVKQTSDQYILIRPADMLGLDAANALLKNLEEPGDKVHFMLVTSHVSQILPTILSRSFIFFLRSDAAPDGPIEKDEKIMEIAKKLVVAKPADLPALAEEITKKKDSTRVYTLDILATAIEILYKSYYKTGKDVFIKKVPKFLECYENIEKNGHTKLHLVADLC